MRYSKTALGQQAFKERSVLLSSKQRAAFLMFDGVKPADAVLQAVAGLGVTAADIEHLLAQGFLEPVAGAAKETAKPPAEAPASAADLADAAAIGAGLALPATEPVADGAADLRTPAERYQQAYPLAVRLVSGLGLRGFRLNLAVEAAGNYDELLALLPKIQDAVGMRETAELEKVLKG